MVSAAENCSKTDLGEELRHLPDSRLKTAECRINVFIRTAVKTEGESIT